MSQQTISNQPEFHRKLGKNLSRLIKPQDMGLPSLNNFNIDDIKKIKEKTVSFLENLSPEDKLYTLLKVPIKKKYLTKLEEDNEMHHNLFVLFFRYLVYLQKFEPHQKTYILALEIDEYKDLEKLKYSFLPGLENIYEKFEELNDFEYLIYIVKIDGRWAIEILRISDKKPFLIDFISPMLSNVNHQQLHIIISKIHQDLYEEALTEDYLLLDKLISREINDYSIYTCFISYYITMNQDWKDLKENVGNLSEDEMKSFTNKILWIIYTVFMKNYLLKENTIINNNNNNNKSAVLKTQKTFETPTNSPELNRQNSSYKRFDSNNYFTERKQSIVDSKPNSYYLKKISSVPFKNSLENNYSISQKTLVDLLKQMKNEILEEVTKKKTYSELDKFINEELPEDPRIKLPRLDDFHLKFSKNELKEILLKYGEKFKEKITTKANESYTKEVEFYQNYNNFNYLLWYYYNYDSNMYRTLIDEYNSRLHNQLLNSLGLPPLPPLPPLTQKPQIIREELHHSPTLNNSKKDYIPQYNVSVKTEPNHHESKENPSNSMNMGADSKNYKLVRKQSSMLNDSDQLHLPRRLSKVEVITQSNQNISKIEPSSHKLLKEHSMNYKNNNSEYNLKSLKDLKNNKDPNISKNHNHNNTTNIENPSSQKLLKSPHNKLDPNTSSLNHRKSKSFQPIPSINALSNRNLPDIHEVEENSSKVLFNPIKSPKLSHNNSINKFANNSHISNNKLKNHLFLGENKDEKLPIINVKTPNGNINPPRATKIMINDPNTYGFDQYNKYVLKEKDTAGLRKHKNDFPLIN